MARHIMAVCVVCLLCAHRLHCQDHIESLLGPALVTTHNSQEQLNARVYTNLSPFIHPVRYHRLSMPAGYRYHQFAPSSPTHH
ncbi:GM11663 [Drosophila sechellia]|uniref:GM11663 n=1 Tax=Drosophila sechellia TaxID=7238 RepID=B4INH5_DROSE|nr:GM11663 [Drosophila sechellia]